ncbi:unnamed protein product [Polarella glacialis]|uniref:Methyltransferase domain-containing protein n=1 Tax=Polarella glacialis TaxID=89957 RepID=A0A813JIC3_POLGL|nr:unnamed protein product [Polarella glacialis]
MACQPDYLGDLASRLAERATDRRNRRLAAAGRKGAADSSRRLSAEDLRQLGVDESFLDRIVQVEAVHREPATASEASEALGGHGISFVAGRATTGDFDELGAAVQEEAPPEGGASAGGSSGSRAEQAPEWSEMKLLAKYGLGYALLVGMGYEGGGRVPLTGVKRQARVGLQDNEELVRDDPSGGADSLRKKRRKRQGLAEGHSSSEEEQIEEPLKALRLAVLSELCAADGHRLAVEALAQRPRVRRAMAKRPEAGLRLERFVRRFVRDRLPRSCRVDRSAAWKALCGSSSSASWASTARRQTVVRLCGSDSESATRCSPTSDRSSEDSADSEEALELQLQAPASEVKTDTTRCYGCGRTFGSRLLLRQHLLERLEARTTRDPTDLQAAFDPDHCDREVLDAAALLQLSRSDCQRCSWSCPACSWASTDAFCSLVDHALQAPARRVEHERLLLLTAELLLQEPPPLGTALTSWCSPGLARLFHVLGVPGGSVKDYNRLEEETLGPQEDDIFGGGCPEGDADKEEATMRLLGFRADASLCTPLMLAAALLKSQLLDQLLAHGPAAVRAAARSHAGWTAADYAAHHSRSAALVEQLRGFEAADLAELGVKRRPRLLVLADRYFKAEESNALVNRFFRDHYPVFLRLLQPELHTLNDQKRMNKELSESLSVVEAFERLAIAGEADARSWHVVDLCCGKSLTAALLALRHPALLVTSVDRLSGVAMPHYAEADVKGIRYQQLDVLSPDFVNEIQRLSSSAGDRQLALLGMHLCGRLSECAVEAFARVENAQICVLSPCCLPSLEDAPIELKHLYGARSNSLEQFAAWEAHLEGLFRQNPLAEQEALELLARDDDDKNRRALYAIDLSGELRFLMYRVTRFSTGMSIGTAPAVFVQCDEAVRVGSSVCEGDSQVAPQDLWNPHRQMLVGHRPGDCTEARGGQALLEGACRSWKGEEPVGTLVRCHGRVALLRHAGISFDISAAGFESDVGRFGLVHFGLHGSILRYDPTRPSGSKERRVQQYVSATPLATQASGGWPLLGRRTGLLLYVFFVPPSPTLHKGQFARLPHFDGFGLLVVGSARPGSPSVSSRMAKVARFAQVLGKVCFYVLVLIGGGSSGLDLLVVNADVFFQEQRLERVVQESAKPIVRRDWLLQAQESNPRHQITSSLHTDNSHGVHTGRVAQCSVAADGEQCDANHGRGGAAGARLVTAASCRDKRFCGRSVDKCVEKNKDEDFKWSITGGEWSAKLRGSEVRNTHSQSGLQIMVPFLEAQVREALSLVALPAMYSHLSQPREAFKLPHAAAAICNDQQDAEEFVLACASMLAASLSWQDRLNSFLEQLELQDQEFDSAYLYRQEVRIGPRMASQQYILLYQRTELVREQSAAGEASLLSPQKVRRELRIDWGRDGLAFTELDRRLSDDMLILSKVFDPPLKPSQLLKELSEVQGRFFDPEEWASYNFCFHMIDQAPGKEYEYR